MKRARIILTAIVILATVGGVFAFKAKNYQARLLFVPAVNGQCTSYKISGKTTIPGAGILTRASTTITTATCPFTWTTSTADL